MGSYSATIYVTDGAGRSASSSTTITVTAPRVDTPGRATLNVGSTTERPESGFLSVRATLIDPDNARSISYDWQRIGVGISDWSSFTSGSGFGIGPTSTVGRSFRCVISYTDDFGRHTVVSPSSTVVDNR